MPIVTCPYCRKDQTVPRELAGLLVDCRSCGKEYRATEGGDQEPITRRRRRESAGCLARLGLVGAAVVCLAAAISFGLYEYGSAMRTEARLARAAASDEYGLDPGEAAELFGRLGFIVSGVLAVAVGLLNVFAWVGADTRKAFRAAAAGAVLSGLATAFCILMYGCSGRLH